jgi:pimeloyl-[acyl-carrier protein] methyl ester esterase
MRTLLRDDGVRLHVEATGAGPAVLAVHGWSRSSADLAPLAERLPARRVLRPDLRGHGRSGPGPFTLASLAADLAALAEAEDLRGALLLGWSLGGQVALAALAGHPALRGRLAGLVLIGATPRFTEGDGWPHGQPARAVEGLALRVRRAPEKALARFAADCFAPGELDEAGRARLDGLRAAPPPDQAAALAGLDVLTATDLRAALPALDLPALVLHGEADAIVPPGAGRALAAALPRARLRLFPGLGHAPHLSRPDEVAAAVADFAGGLP